MPVVRKKKLDIAIRLIFTGYTVLGGCSRFVGLRFVFRLMFAMFCVTAMLCGLSEWPRSNIPDMT